MRSLTALIFALCILAAASLPKPHHASLVKEAENDLDEVSGEEQELEVSNDDEAVAENDNEEDEGEGELEEDDNNENDAEEEKTGEEDENLEETAAADSENELEADSNLEEEESHAEEASGAELEEDEEDAAQKRVVDDIANLHQALEESDIPAHTRKEARANLDKIQEDVLALKSATPARANKLKEAIHKRMEAFHLMVGDSEEPQLEEEEEEAAAKVAKDVTRLEEAVEESSLSTKDKRAAKANLEALSRDAEEYTSANPKAKELYKQAIEKRMQALHLMLEEDKHETHNPSAVISDIHQMEEEIKSSDLSSHAKKEARANLKQLLRDAEEYGTAETPRRHVLAQAMKLRSQALHQQLEEDN